MLIAHDMYVTEGDFVTYPATLTVSSTGGAADSQSVALALGVYKKTPQTWEGRPVWQSTVRSDRILLYTGKNLEYI